MSPGAEVLLDLQRISKIFPGQVALDNVSFDVRSGEIHALIGQNGSGKSTLIKILAGYHQAEPGGQISVSGHIYDPSHTDRQWRNHLRFIHQDLGLILNLSTVENLALGLGYATNRLGTIRWRQERRHSREMIREFGMEFDVDAPVSTLRPSERAIVAIVRAVADWSESEGVLIMDEPTTALTHAEVGRLFEAVRRVARRGCGVIFVSHRISEVLEIADSVTILRDGKRVATKRQEPLSRDELVELMIGRPVSQLYPPVRPSASTPLLGARGLRTETLRGLDLDIHAGEIVGVTGIVGSGREDVGDVLFGAIPARAGYVEVGGQRLDRLTPQSAIRAGVAYVPADRARRGLILEMRVRENITLPRLGPIWSSWRLSRTVERADVKRWIDSVDLRPPQSEVAMSLLSGGNQQKASIAKWLRTEARILILEEPTQGVDVGAKAAIYELLMAAASRGAGILICSNDAEELANVCNRVLVVLDGLVGVELTGDGLTEDEIIAASFHSSGNSFAVDQQEARHEAGGLKAG
jgi:ABC-type sugar transport system ATPase subunit